MGRTLRIAGIIKESIVDGPGIRLVVFAQGCKHNCPGCHNPHTHSFSGGSLIEIDAIMDEIKANPLIDGITLSGGEPFEQARAMGELAGEAKKNGYNVIVYTGYTYEYLRENIGTIDGVSELLSNTDILIDGKFELSRKNLMLKFRGSENQRVIDIKNSITQGKIVEIEI